MTGRQVQGAGLIGRQNDRQLLTPPTLNVFQRFVSHVRSAEIKLKQNIDGVGRLKRKKSFVSVLFQFHFTCEAGLTVYVQFLKRRCMGKDQKQLIGLN